MIGHELAQLESVTDPVRRSKILAGLYTRIASGLELGENKPIDIGMKDLAEPWNRANDYLLDVARKDPKEGYKLAVALIEIPRNDNPQRENLNRWMRSSGLMLLGLDELKQEFIEALETNPDTQKLASTLSDLMTVDLSHLTTEHHFEGDPTGYLTIQSIYICLGLAEGPGETAKDLYDTATKRKSDLDIETAYGIISSFPDCIYLRSRFEAKNG